MVMHRKRKPKAGRTAAPRISHERTATRVRLMACVALAVTCSFSLQGKYISSSTASTNTKEPTVEIAERELVKDPTTPAPTQLASTALATAKLRKETSHHPPHNKLPIDAKLNTQFCVPWETNTDEWWSHHPDWVVDVASENATHTCFQQLQDNPKKTKFLRILYQHQWHGNCNDKEAIYMDLSSHPLQFSLATWQDQWHPLVEGLAKVLEFTNQPFQLLTNNNRDCPERGTLDCFFLPIGHCPTHNNRTATHTPETLFRPDQRQDLPSLLHNNSLQYRWYLDYLIRPRSWLRKQVYDALQPQQQKRQELDRTGGACALLHVDARRGPDLNEVVKQQGVDTLPQQILVISDNKIPQTAQKVDSNHTPTPLEGELDPLTCLLGSLRWMQRFPCSYIFTVEGQEESPVSNYLYWELVAALNRPKTTVHAKSLVLGKERTLELPQRILIAPSKIRSPEVSYQEDAIQQDTTTSATPNMPGLSSDLHPPDYAEYDDYRQEYKLKVDIKKPNGPNTTICLPWTVNGDHWWTHHRDWEAGPENATHYCFQKVKNTVKAKYFRELYKIQFGQLLQDGVPHCDNLVVKRMWNSGFGADMFNVVDGLHHAYRTTHPVQILESTAWHYAYPKRSVDSAKPIKAACPQKNMYCYLLNMTDCSSGNQTTADSHENPYLEDDMQSLYYKDRYHWYLEWIVRPQTWLRKRVYDYIQQHAPKMETPCTAMHVRRNDVVLHDSQARKFHSIKEYIEAASDNVRPNILLMTDDHNAIGEATTLSPEYNWMYLDRPRFRGVGGWEHQIPSDDPVLEVVILFSLFRLIRSCDQFIMSSGKFSTYLYQEMMWNRKPDNLVDLVDIDKFQDYDKDVMNAANYHTHVVSKNYDAEDATADKKKKMLTAGGKRFVGDSLPKDLEFDSPFCQPWDVDADEWWTHHPTWGLGNDNETHYCFQPIADAAQADLLQDLYQVQFVEGDCNQAITKRMWSAGWGADMENVVDGLFHAINTRRPLQMGLERWHYADPGVKQEGTNNKNDKSIACPRRSMFCYYLELSRCDVGPTWPGEFLSEGGKHMIEYVWLQNYATRPQTWLRKRVYDFVRKQQEDYFKGECAVIHVRRGDVVDHEDYARKYHAIKEYLDFANEKNVTLHKNILLLSDDSNAFAEAKTNFPDYNWMQIDRPRIEAKDAKWEQHLPSNDPILEMVVIQSIFKMVKQCDQFVYSASNFADHIRFAMELGGKNPVKLYIDEGKQVFSRSNSATRNISKHFDSGRR